MKPRRRFGKLPDDVRAMKRGDACAGKVAFSSRSDAQSARDAMGNRGKQCRVYPCTTCLNYHLASKDRGRLNRGKH